MDLYTDGICYSLIFIFPITQRVFCRFALHNIVNVIHYTSIYQTTIVVIRTINEGHRNTNQECDLHLYECQDNVSMKITIDMIPSQYSTVSRIKEAIYA